MAQRLAGKSAVVTGGGAGGIGEAVCLALAQEGAKVVVNDIGRGTDGQYIADAVVTKIKEAGGSAVANYDSVATIAGGQNMVQAAVKNFGRIDILVNCAGNIRYGTIEDQTDSDWDAVIAVHLKGHFSCSQAAAKEMIKQKSGRIINISSTTSFAYSRPGAPPRTTGKSIAYTTSKAGIVGFTIALASHLEYYGITVNGILPGAITKLFPEQPFDKIASGLLKRGGPDSVAPMIVYLCTDAAKNITGRFFYAGGGGVRLYERPFQQSEGNIFAVKSGKWTLDELDQVVPSMTG
jgi:NAD(P)-dependent dehydrogenase (short-subunit alcohol dehydrogenase family)